MPALSRRSPRLNWGGGVRRGKMFWRALSEVLASSDHQRFHSNRAEDTGVEPVRACAHEFSRLAHYRPAHLPTEVRARIGLAR